MFDLGLSGAFVGMSSPLHNNLKIWLHILSKEQELPLADFEAC